MAWAVTIAVLGANFLLFRRAWQDRAALPGVMWLALLLGMVSGLTLVFVGWIDRPSHIAVMAAIALNCGNFLFHTVRNWAARNWGTALGGTLVGAAVAFSVFSSW